MHAGLHAAKAALNEPRDGLAGGRPLARGGSEDAPAPPGESRAPRSSTSDHAAESDRSTTSPARSARSLRWVPARTGSRRWARRARRASRRCDGQGPHERDGGLRAPRSQRRPCFRTPCARPLSVRRLGGRAGDRGEREAPRVSLVRDERVDHAHGRGLARWPFELDGGEQRRRVGVAHSRQLLAHLEVGRSPVLQLPDDLQDALAPEDHAGVALLGLDGAGKGGRIQGSRRVAGAGNRAEGEPRPRAPARSPRGRRARASPRARGALPAHRRASEGAGRPSTSTDPTTRCGLVCARCSPASPRTQVRAGRTRRPRPRRIAAARRRAPRPRRRWAARARARATRQRGRASSIGTPPGADVARQASLELGSRRTGEQLVEAALHMHGGLLTGSSRNLALVRTWRRTAKMAAGETPRVERDIGARTLPPVPASASRSWT